MFSTLCFRCICFVLISSTTLHATDLDVPALQKKIYSTIESVTPAIVSISIPGLGPETSFSGVIVSKDGHILSAAHAVESGVEYKILLPDGRKFSAQGKGSNLIADCAMLRITDEFEELPYVQMGESNSLVKNQPCLSISYPVGQRARLSPVVRFGRLVRGGGGKGWLQSTALMEPGDSGGPLFDLDGRVIGIHSRIKNGMEQNFEVPIDTFKEFWSELNREKAFTRPGPTVPRLGFKAKQVKGSKGTGVSEVDSDSLAEEHGIKPNDIIESVHGTPTRSKGIVRRAMLHAYDNDVKEVVVKILRGEEQIEITIPVEAVQDLPEVALPEYEDKEFSEPQGIDELANFPKEFSELESDLDDACVKISSTKSTGKELSIIGTRIKTTPFIISKNSMVGENPMVEEEELEIVGRDTENDLILLRASRENADGVDINMQVDSAPKAGSFLITPESDGVGVVSVVGTKSINSPRIKRRGFLGVMPATYKDNGGALLETVTKYSAAQRAGLKVGDVITKLNETTITNQLELRKFLATVESGSDIVAILTRDEEELTKTIVLKDSNNSHIANNVAKSVRRDGFSKVILHDADLKPAECGGPVFDLSGNFVGLNIARNSRVRSYLIPPAIVKELVDTSK